MTHEDPPADEPQTAPGRIMGTAPATAFAPQHGP